MDGGEQPIERISHAFGLSLFKSDNAEQVFTHYDKKAETEFFLQKAWGLVVDGVAFEPATRREYADSGSEGSEKRASIDAANERIDQVFWVRH